MLARKLILIRWIISRSRAGENCILKFCWKICDGPVTKFRFPNPMLFFWKSMNDNQENERLYFEGPTRGLLGYKNQFVIDTKGLGILSSRVIGFRPYAGEI